MSARPLTTASHPFLPAPSRAPAHTMALVGLVTGLVLAAAALLSSSDAVREVLVEGLPWGCVFIPMALGWTLGRLSSTTEA